MTCGDRFLAGIWACKSTAELAREAAHADDTGDVRPLRRSLSALNLTALGIGGIIGAGIFVLTGHAAAANAGPAVTLSFLLGAVACAFAGLCYAEMSSTVPISGSAYTYAYATLGELAAWIIGWDLILEYAIGSSVVAAGWSNYFDALMRHVFGGSIDPRLQAAPWDYDVAHSVFYLKKVALDDGRMVQAWINAPAIFITAVVTIILVIGIRESAGFNAAMVLLNIGVILTLIGIGA